MGYCHCDSCRRWSAGPVNGFSLWKSDALKIPRGGQSGSYNMTDRSYRKWCTTCGGHLMTEHPHWGLTDVYAAVLEGFPFKPGVHANYQETVLRMKDGLPKMKDFPKELGGLRQDRSPSSRARRRFAVRARSRRRKANRSAKSLAANLDDARREEFKRDMIAWHETFKSELGCDQPRQYVITRGIRK